MIPADYCATCGAPDTITIAVVVTSHTDPLPKCSGCGRTLNEDGRPLNGPYKRIVLPHGNPIADAQPPN